MSTATDILASANFTANAEAPLADDAAEHYAAGDVLFVDWAGGRVPIKSSFLLTSLTFCQPNPNNRHSGSAAGLKTVS